ncbi:glycosyltransferase family 25 protein [Polynucleobacter sphagniphilus]|jgi:GR25 family glycosyltransferase involved in LPS biosynthesis|uniref:GR25 family glycosyltransferase involved in LPS biosynthesis n=1 Tax=Polynucleobacter sphagniphilus TaxID=1743169 RepID=A0AA43MAQ8_9BURK|nr:glycosyltransferase family 25 protein [Polynucleobacter sphagniphilus]MDH6504770.1 GR25 family glycosyltransferase involved in LPS biosynthesis [Polynucleobacter sphagniphilus]MDH6513485.1 GR25 family glycosyltransferase involved in LPS biosynthesis [Polynucleobacter sphagniphilus]
MNVHSYYINLDNAQERRASLEKNFYQTHPRTSFLERVAAANVNDVIEQKIVGRLSDKEKACYLSHTLALEKSLENQEHAFILEDDTFFGEHSQSLILESLASLEGRDWDVLYADVGLTNPGDMVNFFSLRKELVDQSRATWRVLKLEQIAYVGASAYIVNSKSKQKIAHYLRNQTSLDIPYDLELRRLVWEKQIHAYVIFPFATTLSPMADVSQIQLKQTEVIELVWNAFRRLVWFESDRDTTKVNQMLGLLRTRVADSKSEVMGNIMALALADQFGKK